MRAVITGTPGTGKTSVGKELEHKTIDITSFIEKNNIGDKVDGEFEVETDKVIEKLEKKIDADGDIIVEGHLAHHLATDYCIVLRCRPDILKERLSERDYSEEKIEENVEAEALDLILSEAVQNQENIIEIDTTDRNAEDVAEEIERRIKEEDTGYGEVDWSEYL